MRRRSGGWVAVRGSLAACSMFAAALAAAVRADRAEALTLGDASPLQGTATLFHPYPFASVDNAVATVVNPAGLAARYTAELFGAVTDADALRDGDSAVLIKLRRLGLGYERYRPVQDGASVARFTVALGRPITRSVLIGTSYAWYFSKDNDLDRLSSLDLGLLARGAHGISLGVAATGVNRPEFRGARIDRLYTFGVACGPYLQRFTVFAEDAIAENQSLSQTVPAYGLVVEPIAGLLLRSRIDTDGDFRVGFEYNFPQSAYGVVGRYAHDGESDGRAGYLRLTDEIYQPMKSESPRPRRPGRPPRRR